MNRRRRRKAKRRRRLLRGLRIAKCRQGVSATLAEARAELLYIDEYWADALEAEARAIEADLAAWAIWHRKPWAGEARQGSEQG